MDGLAGMAIERGLDTVGLGLVLIGIGQIGLCLVFGAYVFLQYKRWKESQR